MAGKSKKLSPVTSAVKKAVNNQLDTAKQRVMTNKQVKAESKKLEKAMKAADKTYRKTYQKETNRQAKREERLSKLNNTFGLGAIKDSLDTTSRSSSGFEI